MLIFVSGLECRQKSRQEVEEEEPRHFSSVRGESSPKKSRIKVCSKLRVPINVSFCINLRFLSIATSRASYK